ncbi:DNA (cytosine-5-)-methyltransferase [Mycoplasma feriruminatoris]|uniref:Cytosine-specific methyltransferase n=1 Tax=Mycoplasma feriruminatoris TaxID=1179777 RepID=A0AAX3TGN2_9MOLU|nr:DNA cytosine methyltransferase [Mycoplasma feriruminatoris]UKS54439.1 DNA (cytosine-5-)-methyltransferase family protein [Mycoplasma feriruminatoris]WFQ91317.1 DNA (cytosine-5-)-methyltransferase [Mycoplasma feriruminatoris]WFQ92981.1 Modification methylase HaeIII [Mycoplasma feriruminatoris]WFQ93827.1 DNA (cytosine-5-)-methyltransferase [Mycoplasma feriruminatoris]VZK65621.1 Modification methylase HaeIII [Mycoplasma feriruminatoris]
MQPNRKNTIVDLFAGAGGLTLGFTQNDFEILDTVEFWQPAVDTYNYNFKKHITTKDITDLNVRQNLEDNFKNKTNLVIGGFPCQGFSMAGKRSKSDQRNQLYKYTIDVISRLQPYGFVLENVKGILSYKEADGILVIDKIKDMLSKLNYHTEFILLDSSKFGVAQKRERVIFIGCKNKDKVDQVISRLKEFDLPIVTVKQAIGHLEHITNEDIIANHTFSKHSEEMKKRLSDLKEGQSLSKSFSDAFRKISYDKPAPTVKENHGGVHVHPVLPRVLTPRELANLQSFPENFIFLGTKSNVLKQIGNAVPVKLSFEIAKIVKEIFFSE